MKQPLFTKNLKDNFYNYCPCLRLENEVMHVWYCTNKVSGDITDYIGYRQGKKVNDNWVFGKEKLVLGPTPNSWDSRHVCDPSVIKGQFKYNDEQYNYLMVYLGCVTSDNSDNETGIALSKKINGPWIKYDQNPLINFINSPDYQGPHLNWGYGQPCVISYDKLGKCLIFYTVGTSEVYTRVELWDLSNLNNPIKLKTTRLTDKGYINIFGQPNHLNNADFMYDETKMVMYAVSDMSYRGTEQPTYISNALPLLKANLHDEYLFGLDKFLNNDLVWKPLMYLDEKISGFIKNHNPGLVADLYGWLKNPNPITIGYTVSDLNKMHPRRRGIWPSLHTYRIYRYDYYRSDKDEK